MNTGKQMIALFIVIGACLGIAAFVLVLTSKQPTKCPTKENYCTNDSECTQRNYICYKGACVPETRKVFY